MVEMGARFANNLYVKTSLDESDGTCTVEVETISDEGVVTVTTGTVTWDE